MGCSVLKGWTGRPLPENPLHEGSMGHHHKTGDHDMDEYDWNQYVNFADKHIV